MLKGIGIAEYRSVGEMQRIEPLGKINLFVGANNSGKSNILRFINQNLGRLLQRINPGDRAKGLHSEPHVRRGQPTGGAIAIAANKTGVIDLLKLSSTHPPAIVDVILEHIAPQGVMWLDDQWPPPQLLQQARQWAGEGAWHTLWREVTKQSGGGLTAHWIPETLRYIKQLVPPQLPVYIIPIDRSAGSEEETPPEKGSAIILSGKGIIRALAAMQNPEHSTFEESKKRFAAVQDFVRIVTDDPSANISVTHRQNEILVQLKGQAYLPLASLGSGIEQVVLHAVAATSATNAIVTFEEPELHLHPVLQRQLLTYLAQTPNQYFISTHSAHLIDALHVQTFHVRLIDGQTVVEYASTDARRYQVCSDLGYRPSDIVQANCVVWVEGPSDRIYLRHWLKQVDEHLEEHIHYSVMFYGGKLLSHLSAGETDTVDDGLKDLIQLRCLNRQVAVIIDSDITAKGRELRATKTRVVKEIKEHGGYAWVTAGREIENYVPSNVLAAAVDKVAQGRGAAVKSGPFAKALPSAKPNSKVTVDKVATAKHVIDAGCPLDKLDLRDRLGELASFIRRANGLPLREPAASK